MDGWLYSVLGCAAPGCGGKLGPADGENITRDGVLCCKRCALEYPVLGGVPILLPLPEDWVGSYREAIVSSLAEQRRLTRGALAVIDRFALRARNAVAMRFGDDWVPGEGASEGATSAGAAARALGDGDGARRFGEFLDAATKPSFAERLLGMLEHRSLGTVLEIGPGAGMLSRHLRHQASRLVVADLSLRATLRAMSAASRGKGAPVAGAVVDAEALPLRHGAARTVVAANVIDLLDHPGAFLSQIADGLPSNGRLLLTTPDPGLGLAEADGAVLDTLVERSGLRVTRAEDGIPWVRAHDPRHFEVYFVRAVVAEHA
jgi:SAM-dependent methyltransferase/uncharacterized protein YbaR (Trm112 family)